MERYNTPVLISANQNVFLSEIDPANVSHIERILEVNGVPFKLNEINDIAMNHMSCPALPTCGLATTEAERASPELI